MITGFNALRRKMLIYVKSVLEEHKLYNINVRYNYCMAIIKFHYTRSAWHQYM